LSIVLKEKVDLCDCFVTIHGSGMPLLLSGIVLIQKRRGEI